MKRKLPFWATLLTFLGLLILCTLGTWQIQRLSWKEDIIAQLDKAYEINPDTALNLEAAQNYDYGTVTGTFLPQKAILLGPRTREGDVGNDLIVPLEINNKTLFINLGWSAWPLDEMPIDHLQNKDIQITGLIIIPSWNSFTPENKPEENLWFRLDVEEIARVKNLPNPYPFILRAESTNYKMDAAFPNNEKLYPNNNHLQYAIFWFAMAAALLSVYILRFVKRG